MSQSLPIPVWKRGLILVYLAFLFLAYFRQFQDDFIHYDFWIIPLSIEVWITSLLAISIASVIYGFISGYVNRSKGWLFGACVAAIYWIVLLGIVAALFLSFPERSHKFLESLASVEIKFIMPLMIVASFIVTAYGGFYGAKIAQLNEATDSILELDNGVNIKQFCDFYFSAHWQLIFSAMFAGTLASLVIAAANDLFLLILWVTVGSLFILIHPSLWFAGWFADLGIFTFMFIAMAICFYGPIFLMKKCQNQKSKWKKYLFAFLIYIGMVFGINICIDFSSGPMHRAVYESSEKGIKVWSILVPRDYRAVEYMNLIKYHETKGEPNKVEDYRAELYEAVDDVKGRYSSQGKHTIALGILNQLLKKDPKEVHLLMIKADLLHEMDKYEEETSLLKSILESSDLSSSLTEGGKAEIESRLLEYEEDNSSPEGSKQK